MENYVNKIKTKDGVEYDIQDARLSSEDTGSKFLRDDFTWQEVGGISQMMTETTWLELKTLRDNSQLVPGMWYRITDYTCTTAANDTSSAGHVFDIIVLALSDNKLSEEARAIQHVGDTYFVNSQLSAWKLWYCLNNDTSRFAWASNSGKGVIYYLKDEFGNEASYDFKNIIFNFVKTFKVHTHFGAAYWGKYGYSGETTEIDGTTYYKQSLLEKVSGPFTPPQEIWTVTNSYDTNMTLYSISGTDVSTLSYTIFAINNNGFSTYTFNYVTSDVNYDASLEGGTQACFNNFIGEYRVNGVLQLNWTVFYLSGSETLRAYNNHIAEGNCYNSFLGNSFYFNTIDMNFSTNTISSNFINNTISSDFRGNFINLNFIYNTVGPGFTTNTVGLSFYRNTVGSMFTNNTIGSDFGNNTIGSTFEGNSIGSNFYANSIGEYFSRNTVGSMFTRNTVGSDFCYNTIGSSASEEGIYVRYCKFDDGVEWISLTSADHSASSLNYLQNIHIHSGVRGNGSVLLTITVHNSDRNLPYSIDYYAAGSQNITIGE